MYVSFTSVDVMFEVNIPLKISKLANIEGDMSETREDKASIKR